MDLISLPVCAMYRSVGTVIVRIKMEVTSYCSSWGSSGQASAAVVAPGCERCKRTRLSSKHNSDCDSFVQKCQPYRSSKARSKYVNVCAAVCLLLLVGGNSPLSSALPHRSRTMDRQRRDTGENYLWGNPCDYNGDSTTPGDRKEIAQQLFKQAKIAFEGAKKYKDTLSSQLHSYPKFDDLVKVWAGDEWLRDFPWYRDAVLPKQKTLFSPAPKEYISTVLEKSLDQDLPALHKGLKMLVAGLWAFANEGLNDNIVSDDVLKESINNTMHDSRAVLCQMTDLMKALNIATLPLLDDEIPDFKTEDKLKTGLLVYRDTLNYLEYIQQFFQQFYNEKN